MNLIEILIPLFKNYFTKKALKLSYLLSKGSYQLDELPGQERHSFQVLQENKDTSTPTNKLIFHISGVIAESQRNLIRESILVSISLCETIARSNAATIEILKKNDIII